MSIMTEEQALAARRGCRFQEQCADFNPCPGAVGSTRKPMSRGFAGRKGGAAMIHPWNDDLREQIRKLTVLLSSLLPVPSRFPPCKSGDRVADGTYLVTICGAGWSGYANGNQLSVTYELIDGARIRQNLRYPNDGTCRADRILKQLAATLGEQIEDLKRDPARLIGRTLAIRVAYDAQFDQMNVAGYLPSAV